MEGGADRYLDQLLLQLRPQLLDAPSHRVEAGVLHQRFGHDHRLQLRGDLDALDDVALLDHLLQRRLHLRQVLERLDDALHLAQTEFLAALVRNRQAGVQLRGLDPVQKGYDRDGLHGVLQHAACVLNVDVGAAEIQVNLLDESDARQKVLVVGGNGAVQGRNSTGQKVGAKKSTKLSPNCAAIVDNSNCALLDLEQTVLCSAGRRKKQKGMYWVDENAMP